MGQRGALQKCSLRWLLYLVGLRSLHQSASIRAITNPQILSVEECARQNDVPRRTAFLWAKLGKLPLVRRTVEVMGVPAKITKEDVVKPK
jgi:hypothetical protein